MVVTNAMRMLKQAGIPFDISEYEADESDLSGVHAAAMLGIDPDCMFKTLVTQGEKQGPLVFCIPVAEELDLKKCAAIAGEKRIEMIPVKALLGFTGYVRGGCSPIGMKKTFPTFLDETAQLFDTIAVSAGQRGCQVILPPDALADYCEAALCDLVSLD